MASESRNASRPSQANVIPVLPGRRSERKGVPPIERVYFLGLLAVFWLEYLRPGHFLPVIDAIKLNTLVPLALAVATFASNRGRPNSQIVQALDTKWFLFVLCLFAVQFFVVDVKLYVYEILKGFVGYLLLYYVILRQVTTLRHIKAVMATLVFVNVVMLALFPAVILDPEGRHPLGGSFLGDGNDYAWSACIVIPFALFLASTSEHRRGKLIFYSLVVLLILAVIGTQSRGASIALLALIVYMAMKSQRRLAALTGIGMLVVVVLAFAPSAYFERMNTVKQWESEGSAQGRILAWKSAANMAIANPFTGVGAGHYGVKFGFEYKPAGYHGPYLDTHSIYFKMLAEFGFPGIIFLLGVIAGNLFQNRRVIGQLRTGKSPSRSAALRLMIAMQASLIGFMVCGAFLTGVFYPHIFVLTALMECSRQFARDQQSA